MLCVFFYFKHMTNNIMIYSIAHEIVITQELIKCVFNTGAALLDAIVLAVVSEEKEGTYGYKITQEVRVVLDVSESTLYPVLRRLLRRLPGSL